MLKCLKESHDVMPDVRLVGDKWVYIITLCTVDKGTHRQNVR